jgi:Na+/pantothenate symporter
MNGSFISVNYALLFVIVISLTFLFIGTYFSKKNLDLNSYLVSNRNVGVFKLAGTLVASSLGSWILFGPPTAAIDGGLGAIIGYALGTAFTMILLIFFGKKLRKIFPNGKSLTEIILKKFRSNVFKLIFGLMMYFFMRRSNRYFRANSLYVWAFGLDICGDYPNFRCKLCVIWWAQCNYSNRYRSMYCDSITVFIFALCCCSSK